MRKRRCIGGWACVATGCVIVMTIWLPVTVMVVIEASALVVFGIILIRQR